MTHNPNEEWQVEAKHPHELWEIKYNCGCHFAKFNKSYQIKICKKHFACYDKELQKRILDILDVELGR